MAVDSGAGAGAYTVSDADEIMGVNNRVQLAAAAKVMRRRIAEKHMLNGVTVIDPDNVYIENDVVIGNDTEIWPGVQLKGKTVIGSGCIIGSECYNRKQRDRRRYRHTQVCHKGKLCRKRHARRAVRLHETGQQSRLRVQGRRFCVELKNANFGDGSKAARLAYIGDADVGEDVNVGCGVIFANYDGVHKHRSVVGDRALFIGSNSNLVAPVSVAEDAYIAAGTTVTREIPSGALCVGRSREKQSKKAGSRRKV